MIKKILLSLGIIFIGIINYSYASWIGFGVVGDYFTNVNNNSIDLKIDYNGNFNTEIGNIEKGLFSIYNSNDIVDYFYWNTDSIISLYTSKGKNSFVPGSSYGPNGGTLSYFYLCDSIEGNFTSFSNCVKYENTGANLSFLGEIISNININDNIYYGDAYSCSNCRPDLGWTHPFLAINVSNYGKVLLFYLKLDSGTSVYGLNSIDENYYGFGLNYEYTDLYTFDTFPLSLIGTSPFNGGGSSDGGFNGNVEISNDDIVSYYEDTRGFNYNMCFVGSWDFTQNEGTFKQGNGDNIFSYFNWFYNLGTGNNATGYKLSDVGKFIDEMYGNYDIYFNYGNRYSNGDIAYIYKFDINTHILDWIDTGFNNPFEENTYVYTFYPKTLHYYTDYWRLYYYGGDLANYCYYKLNFNNSPQEEIYGNLENDISQSDLNNIGDWKVITNNLKPSQSGNIISVSEDWAGSPLDYFAVENGSGYENFDAGTFFSQSFNRFKGVFGELNPGDFGFGYLPGYIITFMLALILFRFLSH